MKRIKIALILVSTLLMISVTAGVTAVEPDRQAPPLNETPAGSTVTDDSTASEPTSYVVTATNISAIDTEQITQYGKIGVQTDKTIEVRMTPTNHTRVENITWVTHVRPAIKPYHAAVPGSSNGSSLGVKRAHRTGITGDNVTVGVIDSGFDPSNPIIASQVVGVRSFSLVSPDPAHGTSVAEVVAQTAPDSELVLVSITNSIQTKRAVEYLITQDVDIIVMSGGFAAYDDDGDHLFTDVISRAKSEGIVFITSAGNYAQTHWEGDFRTTDGDNRHEWTVEGDEQNCLQGCQIPLSGTVEVYLKWTDTGQSSEYGIGLYDPVTEEYVATATTVESTETNEYVAVRATPTGQPLNLVISNTDGMPDDEIEVVATAGITQLTERVPESSIIAPADVPAAFTIAAYQAGNRQVAPYSSRGPTDDGRIGIDATGYTNIQVKNGLYRQTPFVFAGTSASAPYVAGVAALATQSSAIATGEVTETLRSSSDDILTPGDDTVSGAGVINTTAATATETSAESDALSVAVSPETVTANESAVVMITVTDATTGNPVHGATVAASRLNVSGVTDTSGTTALAVTPRLTGNYSISVSATGYVTINTTLRVIPNETVRQTPIQRALTISDKDDPSQFTQDDVSNVITLFNRDKTVSNISVSQDDVSNTITLFERH